MIPLWPPATYWLGRCQYNVTGRDRSHVLPALSRVWKHVKLSDVSLGLRPRYNPAVNEDVKKPTNQTKQTVDLLRICIQYCISESCECFTRFTVAACVTSSTMTRVLIDGTVTGGTVQTRVVPAGVDIWRATHCGKYVQDKRMMIE